MIDLQLTDKTHDEERQGEALILDSPVLRNGENFTLRVMVAR